MDVSKRQGTRASSTWLSGVASCNQRCLLSPFHHLDVAGTRREPCASCDRATEHAQSRSREPIPLFSTTSLTATSWSTTKPHALAVRGARVSSAAPHTLHTRSADGTPQETRMGREGTGILGGRGRGGYAQDSANAQCLRAAMALAYSPSSRMATSRTMSRSCTVAASSTRLPRQSRAHRISECATAAHDQRV